MRRTWIIAPVVFLTLTAAGLQGAIARWMEPAPSVVAARGGPGVAVPVLAVPTSAASIEREASPTATVIPPTATPAALIVSSARGAEQVTLSGRSTATSLATNTSVPIPTPPPPTPTVAPLDVGPAPLRTGTEKFPQVGAKEIVVIDANSGAILFEQAAHRRVAPASTTKIVTALVALSGRDWSEKVTSKFDESELIDSTLMGLRNGDEITLEDLLYGLMLPSGNDAALAVASHVAGSKARFVDMMNAKTRELGLQNSQWVNPHGLDANGHYSSAFDMVQFARHGMRDPRFQALSAARSHKVTAGGRTYEVPNLNRVLGQVPGADGVKIGYTEDAGRTIVASATRNGHRVYIGAFHSTDLVGDCKPIFEWVFKNFSWGAR